MSKPKLTPKQKRFIEEYLVDLNATQAAIRAKYSKHTAQEQGSRLLSNAMIAKAIQAALDKRSVRVGVDADWVLMRLKQIAGADMSDLATWNASGVSFLDSSLISEDAKASVQAIEESTNEFGGSFKIKQHDKLRALELLGKHLKLFTEKVEVKHTHTLEDLVAGSKTEKEAK